MLGISRSKWLLRIHSLSVMNEHTASSKKKLMIKITQDGTTFKYSLTMVLVFNGSVVEYLGGYFHLNIQEIMTANVH